MFKHWKKDIDAVLKRDPAATSAFEVWLCYPGLRAIRRHRRAHWLYKRGHKLLARMVSQRTRRITGIEIHPGAVIGEGVFIDHGSGVVIGETAVVGDYCTLYQGVTLGGTGKDTGKRHPTLGHNVMIGSGAKVLGPFTVGDNSKIGAGSVVLKEVPPGCTVVGNPARSVRRPEPILPNEGEQAVDLDQVRLPDPIDEEICELYKRIEQLENRCKRHTAQLLSQGKLDPGEDKRED